MVIVGEALRERAGMLEGTIWAEDLPWQGLETFARYLNVTFVEKGEPVFHEGDREPYMGIIVKGTAHVVKQNAQAEQKILSVITKGKTFGEMMLVDGEPRSATVVAASDLVLLILTRANLDRLIIDVPGVAAKILLQLGKLLSQRLRMTSGKLVELID